MKTALIFGITGQTGSYLAEILLEKDIQVIGFVRRTSTNNLSRINHILSRLTIEDGDITDAHSVYAVFEKYKPDYCFNLAAQSFVHTSFNQPDLTFQVNTSGVINIIEAIRTISPHTRFLQCSTSEMYGQNYEERGKWQNGDIILADTLTVRYQDENTALQGESPYAISKIASHQLVQLYRKAYNLFAVCAISFNHESPRRGQEFVTQKIISYVKKISSGAPVGKLKLGNIEASRDWSHAYDMARGYWLAINTDKPDDYVFSSGHTHTVKEFLTVAFGLISKKWEDYVEIDPSLFRPSEVPYLRGISTKARTKLNWRPQYDFVDLVEDMLKE